MDQPPSDSNPAETLLAAVRAFGARDWTQAEVLCRQVLLANSQQADALHVLGLVFSETGRTDLAIAKLQEASTQQPKNAVLWSNLGKALCDSKQFAEAADCQRTAIDLKESFPAAHYNLSLACVGLGQFDTAIAAARRATELQPDYDKAHYHLGNLLREEGRLKEAVAAYQAALRRRADWPEALFYLGLAWLQLGHPAQAIAQYREAMRLAPVCTAAAEHSIGDALVALGQVEEAKAAYSRGHAGTERKPSPMHVLFRESLAEAIPPDHASIEDYKVRSSAAVQAFASEPGTLDLPNLHTDGATPSLMLAYYGGNVRPIMEQYAQAIGPLIPRLPLRPRQGKPKLGIIVTIGHQRVFARCWGGIAERLSRDLFDVRVVCPRVGANYLQTALKIPKHEYLLLPDAVDAAARLLDEQEFDWLHYWEIGTDTSNYYLPFFRPAPGQSTCWGWPVTSGNSQVNSYLSCEQLEPPDGPAHCTEQLVLLEHLPTYFVRPPARSGSLLRSRFGLGDCRRLYLCTQNLRKYHPDFDPLLADLLRSDAQGVVAIIADAQASITELLLDRFRRTMADVTSRIRVMPRLERDNYLSLAAVADVIIDTPHFGAGANTVYDAAAVGTPLVTLPGEFHRTQWAAAVNRRLGLERLIASTPQEYVATAVEVATDADLRQALRQQVLQAGAELFEDTAVVSEHEAYFSEAIAASRAGST